jgi:hypothetical protein
MATARLLADLLVVVHCGYVAFVVLGMVAILVGGACGWEWVRNFWFRLAHLLFIMVVAAEAIGGIVCPLTRWEYHLRVLGGEEGEPSSFVGRLVHRLLFYDFPEWVFTTVYCACCGIMLAALVVFPPRWPGRRDGVSPAK